MWSSQGKITVAAAGTPVQVSATRVPCQTVLFQQVEANTGKIWICDRANAVKSTGVGVLATIPAPTLNGGVATVLPYASVTTAGAPGGLNLALFWIDADNTGETCQVSFVSP